MAQVGLEDGQVEPGSGLRPDEHLPHSDWRPAGAIDGLGDLFAGMELLARSVRDTVRQLQEDAAVDDARTALVEALVVALRTHGKAENDFAFFSSAVKVARKDEDTWEQLASAYRRYVAPGHAKLAAARGAPQVCFVRYRGSRERMAAFQLWVRLDPGKGYASWPPSVLDYPIREAPGAVQAASNEVTGSAADDTSAKSASSDAPETTATSFVHATGGERMAESEGNLAPADRTPHSATAGVARGRDTADRHGRLVETLHVHAALVGSTTGVMLVFAVGSLLLLASIGAVDSALGWTLGRFVDAIRSLVGDFNSWSIR